MRVVLPRYGTFTSATDHPQVNRFQDRQPFNNANGAYYLGPTDGSAYVGPPEFRRACLPFLARDIGTPLVSPTRVAIQINIGVVTGSVTKKGTFRLWALSYDDWFRANGSNYTSLPSSSLISTRVLEGGGGSDLAENAVTHVFIQLTSPERALLAAACAAPNRSGVVLVTDCAVANDAQLMWLGIKYLFAS